MTATAVIPVKGLAGVKRRLSTRLGRTERATIVKRLLARELDILSCSPRVDRVIVVTSDKRVAALAESKGAFILLQPDNGVNAAIRAGIETAQETGEGLTLAIHGDLPLIQAPDIDAMIEGGEECGFAIAPDRYRSGTNAIAVRQGVDIGLHFGRGSFQRFLADARSKSIGVRIVARPGLGLDLDTPADLLEYRRRLRGAGDA